MADNARGILRSTILKNKRGRTITVDFFGQDVEVRQPTVGQILKQQDETDRNKLLVNLIVEYCYVPGTDERVFTKEDYDEIVQLPVGKWFNDLNSAIADLTGVNVEEAEKNSESTA